MARQPGLAEADAIALLERVLVGGRKFSGVTHGIGDDAAVLERPREDLVWTVDASLEGTHFDLSWLTLEDVGWRSFHAAVSDIAAMGATPLAALSNLGMPLGCPRENLEAFAQGQSDASRACSCPVVGGNLARAETWQVTTTVLGTAPAPLLRTGARPNDEVWLLGRLGLAGAGLRLLQSPGSNAGSRSRAALDCIEAWRRPHALLREGRELASLAHAAMDVSDGISADLPKLARASSVRIIIEERLLERSLNTSLIEVARELGVDALALAVQGGEDYALVATGSPKQRPDSAIVLGRVEPGQGAAIETDRGVMTELRDGFDHLAGGTT